jgi:hypothetical protein
MPSEYRRRLIVVHYKAISVLDAALKKLNLGVSAWVRITGGSADPDGRWWARSIGYTKVKDKWGIALRDASGNVQDPDDELEQVWLFSEAPRWMRAESVGRIPDLLEALTKQAEETTKTVEKKTAEAYDFAQAISDAAMNDLRTRIVSALKQAKLTNVAHALERSRLVESDSQLIFTTSEMDRNWLKSPEFEGVLRSIVGKLVKFTIEEDSPPF